MDVMDDAERAREEVRARIHTERHRLQLLVDSLTANFVDLTEAADASPPRRRTRPRRPHHCVRAIATHRSTR